jgi:hypothetical protein
LKRSCRARQPSRIKTCWRPSGVRSRTVGCCVCDRENARCWAAGVAAITGSTCGHASGRQKTAAVVASCWGGSAKKQTPRSQVVECGGRRCQRQIRRWRFDSDGHACVGPSALVGRVATKKLPTPGAPRQRIRIVIAIGTTPWGLLGGLRGGDHENGSSPASRGRPPARLCGSRRRSPFGPR